MRKDNDGADIAGERYRVRRGVFSGRRRLRIALPLGEGPHELRRHVVERESLRSGRRASLGRTMHDHFRGDATLHDFFERGLFRLAQAVRRDGVFASATGGGTEPPIGVIGVTRFLAPDERRLSCRPAGRRRARPACRLHRLSHKRL